MRHPLHLRIERTATIAGRSRPNLLPGREELRHVGRSFLRGGDGRRARRGGAGGDRPSARRVPQDLQLLPDVPPVHVRRVLERHRGPVPDLRADRGPRGARDARPHGDGAGARRHQRARRACRRRPRAGPVAGGRPVAGSPRARARHRGPGRRRDRGRGPDAARGRCRRGRVRHPGARVHRGHDGRRGLDGGRGGRGRRERGSRRAPARTRARRGCRRRRRCHGRGRSRRGRRGRRPRR